MQNDTARDAELDFVWRDFKFSRDGCDHGHEVAHRAFENALCHGVAGEKCFIDEDRERGDFVFRHRLARVFQAVLVKALRDLPDLGNLEFAEKRLLQERFFAAPVGRAYRRNQPASREVEGARLVGDVKVVPARFPLAPVRRAPVAFRARSRDENNARFDAKRRSAERSRVVFDEQIFELDIAIFEQIFAEFPRRCGVVHSGDSEKSGGEIRRRACGFCR